MALFLICAILPSEEVTLYGFEHEVRYAQKLAAYTEYHREVQQLDTVRDKLSDRYKSQIRSIRKAMKLEDFGRKGFESRVGSIRVLKNGKRRPVFCRTVPDRDAALAFLQRSAARDKAPLVEKDGYFTIEQVTGNGWARPARDYWLLGNLLFEADYYIDFSDGQREKITQWMRSSQGYYHYEVHDFRSLSDDMRRRVAKNVGLQMFPMLQQRDGEPASAAAARKTLGTAALELVTRLFMDMETATIRKRIPWKKDWDYSQSVTLTAKPGSQLHRLLRTLRTAPRLRIRDADAVLTGHVNVRVPQEFRSAVQVLRTRLPLGTFEDGRFELGFKLCEGGAAVVVDPDIEQSDFDFLADVSELEGVRRSIIKAASASVFALIRQGSDRKWDAEFERETLLRRVPIAVLKLNLNAAGKQTQTLLVALEKMRDDMLQLSRQSRCIGREVTAEKPITAAEVSQYSQISDGDSLVMTGPFHSAVELKPDQKLWAELLLTARDNELTFRFQASRSLHMMWMARGYLQNTRYGR